MGKSHLHVSPYGDRFDENQSKLFSAIKMQQFRQSQMESQGVDDVMLGFDIGNPKMDQTFKEHFSVHYAENDKNKQQRMMNDGSENRYVSSLKM